MAPPEGLDGVPPEKPVRVERCVEERRFDFVLEGTAQQVGQRDGEASLGGLLGGARQATFERPAQHDFALGGALGRFVRATTGRQAQMGQGIDA